MEKLIFPVSVTQKEQLSGVFIFDFEKSAFLAHPSMGRCGTRMEQEWDRDGTGTGQGWDWDGGTGRDGYTKGTLRYTQVHSGALRYTQVYSDILDYTE